MDRNVEQSLYENTHKQSLYENTHKVNTEALRRRCKRFLRAFGMMIPEVCIKRLERKLQLLQGYLYESYS